MESLDVALKGSKAVFIYNMLFTSFQPFGNCGWCIVKPFVKQFLCYVTLPV